MTETAVFLKALTPEAKVCLKGENFPISRFPFRVGRESRVNDAPSWITSRRKADSPQHNDPWGLISSGSLEIIGRSIRP